MINKCIILEKKSTLRKFSCFPLAFEQGEVDYSKGNHEGDHPRVADILPSWPWRNKPPGVGQCK